MMKIASSIHPAAMWGSNALTKSIDRTLWVEEQPLLYGTLQNTTLHAPAEQCMSFHISIDSNNIP
jgi:hypothetical protein